jgi:hypothetical protein
MQGYLGSLSYFTRTAKRSVILVVSLLAAILIGTFAIPLIFRYKLSYGGMSDNGLYFVFMIVMMFRAARKDTIFLTSRPVARRSIFLAALSEIVALAALLAITIAAFQNIGYWIYNVLTKAQPEYFGAGEYALWNPFTPDKSWSAFSSSFMRYLPVGVFAYTYACFLTRWKGLTIGLSVGIPLLFFAMLLLPVINDFIADFTKVVEDGKTTSALFIAPKWIEIIQNIISWFGRNWRRIYWTACACCVPISFFVMRTTRYSGT